MPQVTSPEPRTRPTAAERAARATKTARANNPKRPYVQAPDGYAMPTPLEIEEGAAHKAMFENPRSKIIGDEWGALHWRLYLEEGQPATTRCGACHVVLFGRPGTVPCGACGNVSRLEYRTQRYEPEA